LFTDVVTDIGSSDDGSSPLLLELFLLQRRLLPSPSPPLLQVRFETILTQRSHPHRREPKCTWSLRGTAPTLPGGFILTCITISETSMFASPPALRRPVDTPLVLMTNHGCPQSLVCVKAHYLQVLIYDDRCLNQQPLPSLRRLYVWTYAKVLRLRSFDDGVLEELRKFPKFLGGLSM
jgi:hypothetical protein